MPATLDTRPALIVIDLQKGIVGLPTAHPAPEIIGRAARIADAFRQRELPVVLVNVAGGAPGRTSVSAGGTPPADWADLVPDLKQQDSDHTVTKFTWGAFHDTNLDSHLRDVGATQVVIVGIATSIGVESTARSAHEHGFNVVLVTDAMTDLSADSHDHSVGSVFPKLGELTNTEELLDLLDAAHV